jgi:hypothetical protein
MKPIMGSGNTESTPLLMTTVLDNYSMPDRRLLHL